MSETYEDKVLKALATLAEQNVKLAEILKPQKNTESSKTATELINLHTHTPKEMFDCPSCGGPYLQEAEKRLRSKIEKETKEKLKNKELVTCDDCGEIVEKEAEECPTCHGKSAH